MTSGKVRPRGPLCSVVSRAAKEDPAGCGTPFVGYLGMEVAPPWMDDVSESPRFPDGLREAVDKAQHAGVIGKFAALFPDPVYSREGYVRTLYLHKPPGPFAAYEKSEYAVPKSEIVSLVEALAEGSDGLSRFERYEEDTSGGRDLLVCTHGSLGEAAQGVAHEPHRRSPLRADANRLPRGPLLGTPRARCTRESRAEKRPRLGARAVLPRLGRLERKVRADR